MQNDYLDRHDRMVKLEKGVNPFYTGEKRFNTYRSKKKPIEGHILAVLMLLIGLVLGIVLFGVIRSCDAPKQAKADCAKCHNYKAQFTAHLKAKGSKNPEAMADALLQSNNPRLLAAIAIRESNANSHIRNTGYKKRHSGAYQVASKYWGKVPADPLGQTIQAEKILVELTEKKPIVEALNYYGGESILKKHKNDYAGMVLAEMINIPKPVID